MTSCFGLFRRNSEDDRQPLLPQYNDDTTRQRLLHQKLHSYQMLRAIRDGYMPSTEQLIANLRSLLAADVLNPDDPNLSDAGRRLTKFVKNWLKGFIAFLQHKNSVDQIQDFIWFLLQSRVSIDTSDIVRRATNAKAKADTVAG